MTLTARLARFVGVGALSTVVEYGALAVLVHGAHVVAHLANPAAYALAAIVNFLGSRYVTFSDSRTTRSTTQLARFAVVHGVALGLDTLLALFAEAVAPRWNLPSAWLGKALALPIIAAWNFTLHRLWTFKRDEP